MSVQLNPRANCQAKVGAAAGRSRHAGADECLLEAVR
ncbi:MAG: hypothetical protein FAZ92_02763 [Accumulibacter sp.]|nr:MAG: hypothetical protein FAZ92_02763 [Accumulibacter sp.]